MRYGLRTIALIAGFSILVFSCRKKDDPVDPGPTTGKTEVHVNFKNFAGNDSLKLNTGTYTSAAGENFTVTTFNYYISNIKLLSASGDYTETNSYHLIKQDAPGSWHFHMEDVPYGAYTGISFMIGVDSLRNTDGAQTGALDPIQGMFWDWNTGYIMAKLEGKSPSATSPDSTFRHHIGGFKGANNVIRTVTLQFPSAIALTAASEGSVVIKADLLKWFLPSIISIPAAQQIMSPGPTAVKIADNYSKMFSILSAGIE